jgi:hypothetical protein
MKKKKKAAKKLNPKSKAESKPVPSTHPIRLHANKVRETVHSALADAGIHDLRLQSMQFGPGCPDGEHAEQTCVTNPDGSQTCSWTCVPN